MHLKKRLFNKVILSSLLITIIIGFSNCKKEGAELLTPTDSLSTEAIEARRGTGTGTSAGTGVTVIDPNIGKLDLGFAFRVPMDASLISDSGNEPTASTLKVYENGVEIGPAHSLHDDIRNTGKGRFSHWMGYLYFSASDNSNPQTNGRKYTYTVSDQGKTPTTVAPTPDPTETNQGISALKPIGYAAVNGMTTGGAGGETVTVTSLAQLKSAAGSSSTMIIKVSGTITGTGSVVVRSNKSIIGLTGATLNGVGLRLFGNSTSDYVKNIIIQNLKIKNVIAVDPATGGNDNDAIGLKWAEHVWVDHCELSADLSHSDWEYYDGLLDISKQSDYVTVSWTKFSNSFKGTGVGGSSDAGLDNLHITYHHNLFENIGERAPSFGYGTGHLFNNYFLKSATSSGYSVGSRLGSVVLVENNYFESIANPIRTDIESPAGYVGGLTTNIFKDSGAARVNTSPSSFVPTYEYKSALTAAANVPSVVLAGVGQK